MERPMGRLLDAILARLSMEINQQCTGPAKNPWLVPYLIILFSFMANGGPMRFSPSPWMKEMRTVNV
jgi:hypothetical protein